VRTIAVVVAALALAGGASAYPWPLKPFHRAHPIRANFGDPRTVFFDPAPYGLDGPGIFSFHNGVDISAPAFTPVYPVRSGVAHVPQAGVVAVRSKGVTFQYWHIVPLVSPGEHVVQSRTLLGWVEPAALHVHLTELHHGVPVNPLLPGHLEPYADHTRPTVTELDVRDAESRLLTPPYTLCGTVSLAATAEDTTSLPVPGVWAGLPVTPAIVEWTLRNREGVVFVQRTAADFLRRLPSNARFWDVYARGTFQNTPRVGRTQIQRVEGNFLFTLAPRFDTARLPDGVYVLKVTALDARGNEGSLSQPVTIANGKRACT
jgi:hypothetical protein